MNTKPTEYIDITPTWSSHLGTLLLLYTNGNATGRKAALEELQRMAAIADSAKALRETIKSMA